MALHINVPLNSWVCEEQDISTAINCSFTYADGLCWTYNYYHTKAAKPLVPYVGLEVWDLGMLIKSWCNYLVNNKLIYSNNVLSPLPPLSMNEWFEMKTF
jgi:hypothetical protein